MKKFFLIAGTVIFCALADAQSLPRAVDDRKAPK